MLWFLHGCDVTRDCLTAVRCTAGYEHMILCVGHCAYRLEFAMFQPLCDLLPAWYMVVVL